jgi:tetratricopeptide (TPR) repeat protein
MRGKPPTFDAYDPKAIEIIQSVLDAQITPQEGAIRIIGYWAPKELLQSTTSPLLIQTRQDSLSTLDRMVIELLNQGLIDRARRLAEMNWIVAKRSGDQELMMQCASSLAQVMTGDPASTSERLALLEFAVPLVLESERANLIKAVMLAHLADARFTEAGADPSRLRATIDACQRALAIDVPLNDAWLGRLNYVAGTSWNTLADNSEALQASIGYLKTALEHYSSANYADEYASTLNNLGNSYRDLGKKTNDREYLQEALACYKKALPFRREEYLRLRTLGNIATAKEMLRALDQSSISPDGSPAAEQSIFSSEDEQKSLHQFNELLRVGDDSIHTSQLEEEKRDSFRKRAATKYAEAMKTLDRTGARNVRAEGFHRLAVLFLDSTEEDALWTGFCLASTTQRLGKDWSPLGQARVASHRGRMLLMIGYPRGIQYLLIAERLLRDSISPLEQFGQPGEAKQASAYLRMADSLLALCEVPEAEHRVEVACAEEEMKRLQDQSKSRPADKLHKVYRSYLAVLLKIAKPELSKLLGRLGLEAEKARLDRYYLDEFNRARKLVHVALRHREIGDLDGALSVIIEAEECARSARYSAPSIWCELAKFYISLPLRDQAQKCLQYAQELMSMAAEEDQYVEEGSNNGRWMLEANIESYQSEIDETRNHVNQAPSTPQFDFAKTANLVSPDDSSLREQLQRNIQSDMKRPSLLQRLRDL